ncbi:MAG: hypothetical protein JW829_12960 [Pirellulales bacterium]|nr:hypothetical protein [Pirellulales bacterium]
MRQRFRNTWRAFLPWIVSMAVLLVDIQATLGADSAGGGGGGDEKKHAFSWGLVLLCLILGLLLTLRPSHRAEEVKRPVREEE